MMVFTDVQKHLSNNWLALAQTSYIEIYDFAARIHWIIVMFSPKRLRRKIGTQQTMLQEPTTTIATRANHG